MLLHPSARPLDRAWHYRRGDRVPAFLGRWTVLLRGFGDAPAEDPALRAQERLEEGRLVEASARQLE